MKIVLQNTFNTQNVCFLSLLETAAQMIMRKNLSLNRVRSTAVAAEIYETALVLLIAYLFNVRLPPKSKYLICPVTGVTIRSFLSNFQGHTTIFWCNFKIPRFLSGPYCRNTSFPPFRLNRSFYFLEESIKLITLRIIF